MRTIEKQFYHNIYAEKFEDERQVLATVNYQINFEESEDHEFDVDFQIIVNGKDVTLLVELLNETEYQELKHECEINAQIEMNDLDFDDYFSNHGDY